MRQAFVRQLLEAAIKDPNIFLVTGDLGYGVLDEFARSLPDQFLNAGVAEQTMASLAGGLASLNKKVFIYSIGNFSTLRCLEQIRNDICSMNHSVTVVSVGAGFSYGPAGYTHYAIEDISAMRAISKMNVYCPGDSYEVAAVVSKILEEGKPSYLRLGKGGEPLLHKSDLSEDFQDGICLRTGMNATLVFTGAIGSQVLQAADILFTNGIEVEVISFPKISPISVHKIKNQSSVLFTIEEHVTRGGFGSAVIEGLSEVDSSRRVKMLGVNYDGYSLGSQGYLQEISGLSAMKIASYVATKLAN
ncbi:MAG: transketolase C-terminal domain-containing protein [Gammaproteobacteria bacterium]